MCSLRKTLSLALTISLLFQQIGFSQIATELNIAGYLSRMSSNLSVEKFRPPHLRYFSYDSVTNNFKVLLDKGDALGLASEPVSGLAGSTRKPVDPLTCQLQAAQLLSTPYLTRVSKRPSPLPSARASMASKR